MIEPVFFPFTTVCADQVDAVGACCRSLGLYLPSDLDIPIQVKRLADQGRLTLHIPVTGDADRLRAVLADYRGWAAIHGPGALAQANALAAVPMWDPESRMELMGAIAGKSSDKGECRADPLFQARVFLHLAQELDQQRAELVGDMEGLAAKEQALYTALRGEAPGRADPAAPAHDPGAALTVQRLRAWAMLVQAGASLPALMVTTSRAVWGHLMETHPHARIIARFSQVPSQTELDRAIVHSGSGPLPAPGDGAADQPSGPGLVLAVIEGCSCRRFLSDLAGGDMPPATPCPSSRTLLAWAG